MNLCYHCRKKEGWEPRDNGAHTARRMKCDGCGKEVGILPERHWVKKSNN